MNNINNNWELLKTVADIKACTSQMQKDIAEIKTFSKESSINFLSFDKRISNLEISDKNKDNQVKSQNGIKLEKIKFWGLLLSTIVGNGGLITLLIKNMMV